MGMDCRAQFFSRFVFVFVLVSIIEIFIMSNTNRTLIFLAFVMIVIILIWYFLPKNTEEEQDKIPSPTEDIIITSPEPNTYISSPLLIEGEARGTWFFEGDFPIILTDWDGKIIAESYATAKGEWMTEDFVSFSGQLEFEKPKYGERGSLILQKDNPSGLSEFDDAKEITIFFK